METFKEIGLPFSLFLAPVAHAVTDPSGACVLCGRQAIHRFSGACYLCLRDGNAKNVVNTELGMVRPEDVVQGWTHGIPLDDPNELSGYDLVAQPVDPNFPDEKWYHVRVAREYLEELIRTPRYHTWQGELWLFCCQRPSVFLGALPSELISKDHRSPIDAITDWLHAPDWEAAASDDFGSHTYYVFRCPQCDCIRFHDDSD